MRENTFKLEELDAPLQANGLRICLVASRFNSFVVEPMIAGAVDCIKRHGGTDATVVRVPGAWELPVTVAALAKSGRYDAIVALGAVIRGSTPHFDYVAGEATKGLASIALQTGVPIALGVITTENLEQAIERAGSKMGNKGWEAALSAIESANLLARIARHGQVSGS